MAQAVVAAVAIETTGVIAAVVAVVAAIMAAAVAEEVVRVIVGSKFFGYINIIATLMLCFVVTGVLNSNPVAVFLILLCANGIIYSLRSKEEYTQRGKITRLIGLALLTTGLTATWVLRLSLNMGICMNLAGLFIFSVWWVEYISKSDMTQRKKVSEALLLLFTNGISVYCAWEYMIM